MVRNLYSSQLKIPYNRVQLHTIRTIDKRDLSFHIDVDCSIKSLKGVLLLFEDVDTQTAFNRDTDRFYNPKLTKATITIDGKANQLFSDGM